MPRVLGFGAPREADPSTSTQALRRCPPALYRNLHGCPSLLRIVSGATFYCHPDRRIQRWLMRKGSVFQVPYCTALAGTGPSSRACDRRLFRRERVSLPADFRGVGAAFPTDGIVTRSNSS